MKFAMHRNSLFAVLLRSPWWASVAVAVGVTAAMRFVLPELYALFAAAPFLVVAAFAAWRQLRAPTAAKVAQRLEALRAQPWEAFAGAVESFGGVDIVVSNAGVASSAPIEETSLAEWLTCA